MLLLKRPHVRHHQAGGILRGADDGFLLRLSGCRSSAQLHRGLNLGCFSLAHSVLVAEFVEAGARESREAAELDKQPVRQAKDVFGMCSCAQDDG